MADVLNGKPVRPVAEQSTAELLQTASDQISRLVKDELALAKAELAEKGKHAGIGSGLFGAGGVVVFYGWGAAIATLIIVFALFLPLWLAALIWAVVLFLAAGILALFGKNQVTKAVPPEPQATIESVKFDVDEVKQAVKERSRA